MELSVSFIIINRLVQLQYEELCVYMYVLQLKHMYISNSLITKTISVSVVDRKASNVTIIKLRLTQQKRVYVFVT